MRTRCSKRRCVLFIQWDMWAGELPAFAKPTGAFERTGRQEDRPNRRADGRTDQRPYTCGRRPTTGPVFRLRPRIEDWRATRDHVQRAVRLGMRRRSTRSDALLAANVAAAAVAAAAAAATASAAPAAPIAAAVGSISFAPRIAFTDFAAAPNRFTDTRRLLGRCSTACCRRVSSRKYGSYGWVRCRGSGPSRPVSVSICELRR